MQAVQPLDCPQPDKEGERILEVLTCVKDVLGIIQKIEQQTAFQIQQNAEGFRQNAEAIQELSAKLDTHRLAGGPDSLTEVITAHSRFPILQAQGVGIHCFCRHVSV